MLRMRNDPLSLMEEGARTGADVVGLKFGFIQAYSLYSPEVIHRAMIPGDAVWKGTRGSKLLRRILGPGLLTTEGAVWKDRRHRAQPRFRKEALAGMPMVVQRHADRLVADWAGHPEVDAMAGFSSLALAVVCDVLFGVDPGDDAPVIHQALDDVLNGFLWLMTSPIEGLDRWPLPRSRRHRRAVRALNEVVDRLIARRRAVGPLEGDLLSDWIVEHDRGELTDEDLRAEVVTMLLAGHETTANAMSFTLALLGTHPEEQEKVVRALEAGDTAPLDRAFAEGLRLYPPAWMLARAVSERLDLGPITVDPGTFLFVPIAAIQRDPRFWEEPEAFRPDRHLALGPDQKAAFLPFGVGGRKCIGEHFARAEARIALAAVLRAFRVECDAVPAAHPTVTLRPKGGAVVGISRRERAPSVESLDPR
jgi:cytochrome P450